jgi:mannose-6-phosphate isomerase-like protein (cupin superfamily)
MRVFKESEIKKGWFVGDFEPTCLRTQQVEVAVKRYKKGDKEKSHHHKIATELTFIVEGSVSMNGSLFEKGDIVMVEPGESVAFEAMEESINVVVKIPGAKNDKYEDEDS